MTTSITPIFQENPSVNIELDPYISKHIENCETCESRVASLITTAERSDTLTEILRYRNLQNDLNKVKTNPINWASVDDSINQKTPFTAAAYKKNLLTEVRPLTDFLTDKKGTSGNSHF